MGKGRWAMLAAALAVFGGACTDSASGPNSRNTEVLLTDAPFPYEDIAKVEVFIVSVDASSDLDTTSSTPDTANPNSWVNIASPNRAFDLLQLQNGATAVLGNAELPAGEYRAIRMVIDPAQSRIVRNNGAEATVRWPWTPNGLITMHALVEEPLATGPGARIVIDFDVGRSFLVIGEFPEDFVFSPWLRAVNEAATGSIAGEVYWTNSIEGSSGFGGNSGPLANASVTVYRSHPSAPSAWWVAATGRTDAQGRYNIAFLRDDTYHVRISGTTPEGYGCSQFTEIDVDVRQTTTLNAAVFPVDGCVDPDPNPDSTGTNPDTTITTPGGPVASITVQAYPSSGIRVGDSIAVSAQLLNAEGAVLSGRQVTWTTSHASYVQLIQSYGHWATFRVHQTGSYTIFANSEGKQGSATIVVGSAASGPATTLYLSGPTSARVGDTAGVHATLYNSLGQPVPGGVTWRVSDNTVLNLFHQTPNYAVVRGLKAGSADLIAQYDTIIRSRTIHIYSDSGGVVGGPVANVNLRVFPSANPAVGDSLTAFAELTNSLGQPLYNRLVTWSLSDETMLNPRQAYGQSFYGRPVRSGTFTLTATSEGKSASATIIVR